MGAVLTEYPPAHLSETPARIERPAPLMGEHTEQVLRDVLHLDQDEIQRLAAQGVLD
jgi:crotonobetainyl-CoA:carnitine CoA-transferase CaiB-like acyl-CoA transferase